MLDNTPQKIVSLLFLLLVCRDLQILKVQAAKVLDLEPDTLDQLRKNPTSEPLLVMFYASNCEYCRVYFSRLEIVAERLEKAMTVGRINLRDRAFLIQVYQITQLPTILFFRNQNQETYDGEFDLDDIIEYAMNKIDRFIELNVSDLVAFLKDTIEPPIRMVLFIERGQDIPAVYSQLFPEWKKDILFGVVRVSPNEKGLVKSKYRISTFPTLLFMEDEMFKGPWDNRKVLEDWLFALTEEQNTIFAENEPPVQLLPTRLLLNILLLFLLCVFLVSVIALYKISSLKKKKRVASVN
jgi:thiol-disulfide isomerase/thioredoxin